jgi:hypothetical protein
LVVARAGLQPVAIGVVELDDERLPPRRPRRPTGSRARLRQMPNPLSALACMSSLRRYESPEGAPIQMGHLASAGSSERSPASTMEQVRAREDPLLGIRSTTTRRRASRSMRPQAGAALRISSGLAGCREIRHRGPHTAHRPSRSVALHGTRQR